MRHIKRLTDNLKYLINLATSTPETSPEEISRRILTALWVNKNTNAEQMQFSRFVVEHNITELLHFTKIDNLKSILRYGLIPRCYLENDALRLVIRPVFADDQRYDGVTDANCLSISFPNYRMFYRKSKNNQERWVVLIINLETLLRYVSDFSASNAASQDRQLLSGIKGIEALFANPNLRRQLGLPDYYTTNPESEVLQRSVIPPSWIKEVHFYSSRPLKEMQIHLDKSGIKGKIDCQYFNPRFDYNYWKKSNYS